MTLRSIIINNNIVNVISIPNCPSRGILLLDEQINLLRIVRGCHIEKYYFLSNWGYAKWQFLLLSIHLRHLWTRAFSQLTSWTIGFSLQLKKSGHVKHFLLLCGLQNTDHVMPDYLLTFNFLVLNFICNLFCKLQNCRTAN